MAKIKVLIASGISQEVADMLQEAPSEMDIQFLPEGEQLSGHLSDVEILYGRVVRGGFPVREIPAMGDGSLLSVSKVQCTLLSRRALLHS